jgi:hypothetical protein
LPAAQDEDMRLPWLVRARPYLIILPALLLLIGILYPFVMGVFYSFTAYNFKVPNSQFEFVGLRNYVRMFTDDDFLYSTYITLAYAFISTGVELILGLVVAMLLNRDSRWQNSDAHAHLPDDDRAGHRHAGLEDDDAAERGHPQSHPEFFGLPACSGPPCQKPRSSRWRWWISGCSRPLPR